MEHVTYVLEEPWPQFLILGELHALLKYRINFQEVEICKDVGACLITPKQWETERVDYLLPGLQFVKLERLEKGKVHRSGPYRFLQSVGSFALLEDTNGFQFAHPKWIKRKYTHSALYRSTAFWTGHCVCKIALNHSNCLPEVCLCHKVFGRSCWKCSSAVSICKTRLEQQLARKEKETTQSLEESLGRELCSQLWNYNGKCFCEYMNKAVEGRSSSDEDSEGVEYTSQRGRCSQPDSPGISSTPNANTEDERTDQKETRTYEANGSKSDDRPSRE
ncbi:hypothetical protein R1flu_018509 [Riccia fluitans]|uniref:Uncharacterized protein n=1 Tax=Riccia fluitans TaxID=41844 RepID=A0ABD1ZHI8_9MARC